jgi:hypothetical protein
MVVLPLFPADQSRGKNDTHCDLLYPCLVGPLQIPYLAFCQVPKSHELTLALGLNKALLMGTRPEKSVSAGGPRRAEFKMCARICAGPNTHYFLYSPASTACVDNKFTWRWSRRGRIPLLIKSTRSSSARP